MLKKLILILENKINVKCDTVVNISYKDVVPNNRNIKKIVSPTTRFSRTGKSTVISSLFIRCLFRSKLWNKLDMGLSLLDMVMMFHDLEYWIVEPRPKWGENGYIRIQRNIDKDVGLCGIAMQPSIPIN